MDHCLLRLWLYFLYLASHADAFLMKQWHSTRQRTSSLSTTRSPYSSSLARTTEWVKGACWEPAGECVWAYVCAALYCKHCIYRQCELAASFSQKPASSVYSKCSCTARCWCAGQETPAVLSVVGDVSDGRFRRVNPRSSTRWVQAPSLSCLNHNINILYLKKKAMRSALWFFFHSCHRCTVSGAFSY